MASGKSSSGLIYFEKCLVFTVLEASMSIGKSYPLTHYSGTPHSLPVFGSLVILTPDPSSTGYPLSNFFLFYSVSLDSFPPILWILFYIISWSCCQIYQTCVYIRNHKISKLRPSYTGGSKWSPFRNYLKIDLRVQQKTVPFFK